MRRQYVEVSMPGQPLLFAMLLAMIMDLLLKLLRAFFPHLLNSRKIFKSCESGARADFERWWVAIAVAVVIAVVVVVIVIVMIVAVADVVVACGNVRTSCPLWCC